MTTVRKLPSPEDEEGRVESGVTQFGDDWPGIFLRGDNAFGYFIQLEALLQKFDKFYPGDEPFCYEALALSGLRDLLRSCDVREIRKENPDFV